MDVTSRHLYTVGSSLHSGMVQVMPAGWVSVLVHI